MNQAPTARIVRHLLRWSSGLVVVAALAVVGFRQWSEHQRWVATDNAYLDGPVHPVAARLVGTVAEVLVEENSEVTQGQVLVRLDPRDADARRQQTAADLAEAAAGIATAEANVANAEANANLAAVTLASAQLDLERRQRLGDATTGAISRQDLEHAQCAVDTAEAALGAARSKVESARTEVMSAKAKHAAATASHRQAELQFEYTTITAPVAGRVGRRNVETGQPVIPSQPLVAIVGGDLWLTANFKETQVSDLRPGQMAMIRFDALPGREWPGVVESLSPASGARFALLPPDNATGNFTRVVQRVPVRIRLAAETRRELAPVLGPGLSAKVRVRVKGNDP